MSEMTQNTEIAVIGAGHAGIEAALAAAIVSYESEPTTERRSQGRATPRELESAMMVITMEIAGAIVKIAAVTIVFFIFDISIPIALARR